MALLTKFDTATVLRHHFGMKDKAIDAMKSSIGIYWAGRKNEIGRSRIKSAISVIRDIESGKFDDRIKKAV